MSVERDAVVIREGFCWAAFFAAPLWALTYRMWLPALGIPAIYALILFAADILALDLITTITLVLGAAAIVGFCANDWRRITLISGGWKIAGVSAAVDKDTALRRFIDLHPEMFNQRPTAVT